jgi:hypothetical protein
MGECEGWSKLFMMPYMSCNWEIFGFNLRQHHSEEENSPRLYIALPFTIFSHLRHVRFVHVLLTFLASANREFLAGVNINMFDLKKCTRNFHTLHTLSSDSECNSNQNHLRFVTDLIAIFQSEAFMATTVPFSVLCGLCHQNPFKNFDTSRPNNCFLSLL